MNYYLNPKIKTFVRCPHCKQELTRCSDGRFSCHRCNAFFGWTASGSLDLRLKKPKSVELRFDILPSHHLTEVPWCEDLPANPTPEVDFENTHALLHLSRELMSYFPKAAGKDSLMLDIGCGNTVHRQVCEQAGFTYVGVDYDNPKAPYLADAHALPFRDESFEFLLSVAVIEHIQFPFVMVQEANRVLKSGGVFIGTVSFLEPFHSNSFYHHSRLGILNTLQYGGFEVVQIAASTSWTVFAAQARMSARTLFPKVPKVFSSNLISLPQRMSDIWWKLVRSIKPSIARSRHMDRTTGAFYFVSKKPAT